MGGKIIDSSNWRLQGEFKNVWVKDLNQQDMVFLCQSVFLYVGLTLSQSSTTRYIPSCSFPNPGEREILFHYSKKDNKIKCLYGPVAEFQTQTSQNVTQYHFQDHHYPTQTQGQGKSTPVPLKGLSNAYKCSLYACCRLIYWSPKPQCDGTWIWDLK